MNVNIEGPGHAAFVVGLALLEGRATAAPDDDFEAARGALISAVAANDAEWSPHAAYVLGMALFERGDLDGARTWLGSAQRSGHPEWSVGGLMGAAHLAARAQHLDDAAQLFRHVIDADRAQFLPSAWFNLGTVYQQQRSFTEAVNAYQRAVGTGDPEFAPRAANNLGFVLANHVGDPAGARQAFEAVMVSGHPAQARLAADNQRAMDALDQLRRAGVPVHLVEDTVNVAVPDGKGKLKRRWWFPRGQ
jgi:tetratricopeptide (TPR) repeat protein